MSRAMSASRPLNFNLWKKSRAAETGRLAKVSIVGIAPLAVIFEPLWFVPPLTPGLSPLTGEGEEIFGGFPSMGKRTAREIGFNRAPLQSGQISRSPSCQE